MHRPKNVTNYAKFLGILLLVTRCAPVSSTITVDRESSSGERTVFSTRQLEDYNTYEVVPEKWREVPQEPRPPEIVMRLLKGRVDPEDERNVFSIEYTYSSNDFPGELDNAKEGHPPASLLDEKLNSPPTSLDNVKPNQSPLNWKNIIIAPSFCPKGQHRDRMGRCRFVINLGRR